MQRRAHRPGAGTSARLGAVAFIHRFGSTLNPHLHFHFGIVISKGIAHITERLPEILEDGENGRQGMMRELLKRLGENLKDMDKQVGELKRQIKLWHRENEQSRKLEAIAGIGLIAASAFVATVGDAKSLKNARQVPAWLGMVPRQAGTGGKVTLAGSASAGDVYLRTILIHGARAVITQFERKPDQADRWLKKLLARRNCICAR